MTVIGHRTVVQRLEHELPPVTLLSGPPSIGKSTIVEHVVGHHRIWAGDRLSHPGPVPIEFARAIVPWAARSPHQSPFRLVTLPLDDASVFALNALLKVLEEPPQQTRFLLTASRPTLPTISSRCEISRLGFLAQEELRDVLIGLGMTAQAAERAAVLGQGQVQAALDADRMSASRQAVLSLVKAIAMHDHELFDRACRSFDPAGSKLLYSWFQEGMTGRYRWFTEADYFGLRADQPRLRRMFVAVNAVLGARSRLGVRAALEPFL